MGNKYDLIVIGAGPGGYVAAISAAQHGKNVAIVEAKQLGGTCLNRGCIPTKTLLHSANMFYEMNHSQELGVFAKEVCYDMEGMHKRKEEVITGLQDGILGLLKANGVACYQGRAKILSAKQVMVTESESNDKKTLDTDNVIIAAGSLPANPPIEGINLPGVITSDELLEGKAVDYKQLIIIGGGVIGVEFASIYSALGCEVTIIEAMNHILPTADREIAQNLTMILKKKGSVIHPSCKVERITQADGNLCCHYTDRKGEHQVTAPNILVSVGRKPNIEGLFGVDLNITFNRGIVVDENYETSQKGIYAIGDVIDGSCQLAHAASAQAQNAVAAMVGKKPPINLMTVPGCVYTNPEIAFVGLNADQAKEKGIQVKTGKYVMSGNGKSRIEQQERSFIKLVFDAETDVLLGAQLMCARASDMISELSSAIVNQLTIHQLASVIRPHPTFSEAVTEAVEDTLGKAIHIMPKKKIHKGN